MLPSPFSKLPDNAISQLEISSGDVLFRVGETPTGFYFLSSGEMHLLRYTEIGDAIPIHRAFSGQCFAEASLFSKAYHCDAVAQRDCELARMDRIQTLKFMEADSLFARNVSAYLAQQVQDYRRILELRSIRSAQERVLAAIAEGWMKGNIMSFAGQIGLTHEAAYRALSALVKTGKLVKPRRGQYQLSKP